MASFCAKCGAALPAGRKYCGSCGAATGLAPPPITPAVQAPVVAAKPGGALKIILIVIAIFVGLGVLTAAAAMFGLWRVSKSVNIDRSGGVTIATPGGKFSTGKTPVNVTEAEVGAPIYPGATPAEGGIKFGAASGSMATYTFKTSDSVQQVLTFYRDQFGPKASVIETPDGALVTSAKNDNEGIVVTVSHDDTDGKTSISIAHTTSNKQ